jgi:hypothetical protein
MSRLKTYNALLPAALSGLIILSPASLAQQAQYDTSQGQAQYAQPYQDPAAQPAYQNPQNYAAPPVYEGQGAFSQQAPPSYGGDAANPYGQNQQTYYGYAADAQAQAQAQQQAQLQAQQQQNAAPQYAQMPQPVYGQQAPPAQGGQQGSLSQFLDKSEAGKSESKQKEPSGPGMGSKIASGAGALAKVAGTVAAGYMMSRAINRQTRTMQQMGVPPGYGYGMNPYGYGGYGGYGYPPMGYPGYGVMNGLNSLPRY